MRVGNQTNAGRPAADEAEAGFTKRYGELLRRETADTLPRLLTDPETLR